MHFIRAGKGFPALVFVHGFACTHEDWKAQLDFFRRTNEAVACDLRGHGQTPGRPHECSIEHYGGGLGAPVKKHQVEKSNPLRPPPGRRAVVPAKTAIPHRAPRILVVGRAPHTTTLTPSAPADALA